MTELNCKNCAAPLNIENAAGGVITCEYCGSVFTIPKPEQTEKIRLMLASAEAMLDVCKFDDALTLYAKAAEDDPTEPEAWFGKALARFKVQYLKDTVNNRLQPICHGITDSAFADDRDYMNALAHATAEQKAAYEKKAAEIEYIRKEFCELASRRWTQWTGYGGLSTGSTRKRSHDGRFLSIRTRRSRIREQGGRLVYKSGGARPRKSKTRID